MAAEANNNRSGSGSADSYIGSLISLTSKYEIRYEGVLYDINTEESSIGLRNVRSFGTEGRKKDGPQIAPNDKIYEYILFRGSDIKDLQVKSSPVPTTPPIDHDPAIIQSHYSHPPAVPTSYPPPVSVPVTDHSPQTSQMGPPAGSSFQGGMPLHQSGGSLGPWSSPLPPNVNGSGLAMPMYWQGYYPPQMHQQSLLRPSGGLPMPPSMQQPMQYPSINSSLLPGSTNLPVSSLPDIGSPLLQSSSNHSQNLTSSTLPSTLPLTFSTVHSAPLVPDTTSNLIPNKAPVSGYSTTPISGASSSFVSPPPSNIFDTIGNGAFTSDKPKNVTGYTVADQTMLQLVNSGAPSVTRVETPVPSLVTPSQILKSGPTTFSSSVPPELAHKDVEVVQTSPPEAPRAPAETRPPILPLPSPPEQR
ncbi:hypothetical protein MKW94_028946, partial [Papaver nudicaule]|nr:hypothetical protein [Papaver nudicaule]